LPLGNKRSDVRIRLGCIECSQCIIDLFSNFMY